MNDAALAAPPAAIPLLDGLAPLADRYDGFVVDLWGVVHDGTRAFPDAADTLAALRARGKRVVFLTNAPRRARVIEAQLAEFGVPRGLYTATVSSGEATWGLLRDRAHPWFARLGTRAFHIGPERDLSVVEALDLVVVPSPPRADFVLNTGPDPLRGAEDAGPYEDVLEACAGLGLPMVCANPDRHVVVGGRRIICAGELGALYRDMGGDVFDVGKPDPAIYAPVLRALGDPPRARVLAVGDGPHTDLAGARAAGLDAAWVLGGLSEGLDPAALGALAAEAGVSPVAALPAFRW